MTVLGGEDLLPIFLAAVAAVLVFSGIFVRLNRDLWVEALAAAVAWSLAAYVLLGITASSRYWDLYWVFASVVVGYIVSLGSLITLVRRRHAKT